ncbi:MAG: septum formation initiator family protein [Gloeobacteraceae cyanobacterium ES-bin-144]|nr:septum formation initiator family protein [Verrucomicrobiales bacterium]
MEARTRAIQGMGKLALIACCLSLGFVVVATAFPQRRSLEKLEAKLKLAQEREKIVKATQNQRQLELRALREDPAFLELQARDRLDYCRDGEKILRFPRDK